MPCGDKPHRFALMLNRDGGDLAGITHADMLACEPHSTRCKKVDLSPANAYLAVVTDPKDRAMNPGVVR